jgi:hypothetical protein
VVGGGWQPLKVFRQKLLDEDGSVWRGVVLVKQPGLFSPKFGAASSHVFTQSPQDVAVEPGIHSLACLDQCFALPQLLYRWGHQSGLLWIRPRIWRDFLSSFLKKFRAVYTLSTPSNMSVTLRNSYYSHRLSVSPRQSQYAKNNRISANWVFVISDTARILVALKNPGPWRTLCLLTLICFWTCLALTIWTTSGKRKYSGWTL